VRDKSQKLSFNLSSGEVRKNVLWKVQSRKVMIWNSQKHTSNRKGMMIERKQIWFAGNSC